MPKHLVGNKLTAEVLENQSQLAQMIKNKMGYYAIHGVKMDLKELDQYAGKIVQMASQTLVPTALNLVPMEEV